VLNYARISSNTHHEFKSFIFHLFLCLICCCNDACSSKRGTLTVFTSTPVFQSRKDCVAFLEGIKDTRLMYVKGHRVYNDEQVASMHVIGVLAAQTTVQIVNTTNVFSSYACYKIRMNKNNSDIGYVVSTSSKFMSCSYYSGLKCDVFDYQTVIKHANELKTKTQELLTEADVVFLKEFHKAESNM
jgi:hypothetical protein